MARLQRLMLVAACAASVVTAVGDGAAADESSRRGPARPR